MPIPKPRFRIYPGVGIARLGPSTEFFLGPEFPDPGFVPTPPPGHPWAPGGATYRDKDGNIRRQGARFRVYEVTERDWNGRRGMIPLKAREITADDGVTLRWTVTVANRKAFTGDTSPELDGATRIANRAEPATVSGRNQPPRQLVGDARFPASGPKVNLPLAEILTDDKGRLIILPGKGHTKDAAGLGLKINIDDDGNESNDLHSPGWFDDVCDGSVQCEIDGKAADRAWIVTGPPAYAQQLGHLVTLYDVAETIAVHSGKWPPELGGRLSMAKHIYPLLRTTDLQRFVTEQVRKEHNDLFVADNRLRKPGTAGALPAAGHQGFRRRITNRLRNPITSQASGKKNVFLPHWYPRNPSTGKVRNNYGEALDAALNAPQPTEMPLQIGLPFTLMQWKRLILWLIADPQDPIWDYVDEASLPKPARLEDLSGVEQLDALDRAHMGSMVGGSATPGIEVGWKALEASSWGEAFRPAPTLQPGELTFSLSIPWPVDFLMCRRQNAPPPPDPDGVSTDWWPAARPIRFDRGGVDLEWHRNVTFPLRNEAHVRWWQSRGFFKNDGTGKYPEVEGPP